MRTEIQKFSEIMNNRLVQRQEKYGGDTWKEASINGLFQHLESEVKELAEALDYGSGDSNITRKAVIAREAADVANMAMMIVDVCGGL